MLYRCYNNTWWRALKDCDGMTDVAAYASVVTPSISQSADNEIMTSHEMTTFCDLETGAFYLQTQLLQVVSSDSFGNLLSL